MKFTLLEYSFNESLKEKSLRSESNNVLSVHAIKPWYEKAATRLSFGLLLTYLVLRAIITEPLHDEVASYFMYFYHGNFASRNMIIDANNHLLNSFLGTVTERIFGENWFMFRLPNLLAFILYFFSIKAILRDLKSPVLRLLSLLALTCPPYFLEYFAYTRGYGLSMGFLAFALLQAFLFFKEEKLLHFRLMVIALIIGVSANLTLVNSILLVGGLFFLYPIVNKSTKQFRLKIWKTLLFGLICLVPFVAFGIVLKHVGALYYGGKDGLWEHTGRTVMKYVYFWSDQSSRIFLNTTLLVGLIYFLVNLFQKKLLFVYSKIGFILTLIFGNIAAILILAKFFDVNYPEDRTVMYFIPYSIICLAFFLDRYWKVGRIAQFALLFFPITLLFNLSLHTSVFSPDDRMPDTFYEEVKKHIEPQHSISTYGIMSWNWPLYESHSSVKASTPNLIDTNLPLVDIIISKTTIVNNPEVSKLYDTIAHDPLSTCVALKKKNPVQKVKIISSSADDVAGPLEYANLLFYELPDSLQHQALQVSVSGHLQTELAKHTMQLVVQSVDMDGNQAERLYYPFEAIYQKTQMDHDFNHHFVLPASSQKLKEIRVYFWNRWHGPFTLKNTQCTLYRIDQETTKASGKN